MLTVSQEYEGEDLATVCRRLGARGDSSTPLPNLVTKEAMGLLKGLLQLDYKKRLSAKDALDNLFVAGVCDK